MTYNIGYGDRDRDRDVKGKEKLEGGFRDKLEGIVGECGGPELDFSHIRKSETISSDPMTKVDVLRLLSELNKIVQDLNRTIKKRDIDGVPECQD